MKQLVFLSHIHEESELAKLIQQSIIDEFGGFVDVFVSSDGRSIPAGTSFLKHIEDSLVNCIAALYLISPNSVKRNWINFELGAVWIRNVMSMRSGGPEIPTVPICHSGTSTGSLPMPLSNLSAISANNVGNLEFMFKSIQTAVGGSGNLKTNFIQLASDIKVFERKYTVGDNLVRFFKLINIKSTDLNTVLTKANQIPKGQYFRINLGLRDNDLIKELRHIAENGLDQILQIKQTSAGMGFGAAGPINGGDVEVLILVDELSNSESLLRSNIK